ncbi:MAG: precorrin-6y C5,15-methyltransferase (decarboxylating) subunit CbiE [Syntrophobacterales bacterium CG_4_8_14_3_um_filter_58_8]|nr:MAG: precorrin-6y C5,15-methyltransferase (decarboxylating) subunit CbiE [Syntrophobacterales bacterium CG03_land_8_20_14_0_80_58_14]PJC72178.1 MAG: precorrin-6y C5,15-methyltransferase (decarboxylating) subunit CbiE [Syntrophobacterales bacterium CG_4_8_14_3_um_filter_58_8]
MTLTKKKIIIVGCGPGAESYITPAARAAAARADVLIVSRRLKDLFPKCPAERIDSGVDIDGTLDEIAARYDDGRQVVLLATGDPGIFSLAKPVIRRFGRENCEVIPGISSVQVAFARLGLDWQDARIISAHSSDPEMTAADLRPAGKIAVLGGREAALAWIAGLLRELGSGRRVFVCEELTLPGERIREVAPNDLAGLPVSSRVIVLIIQGELLS